ncbi:hypothetical protein [Niastella sp. OAS944]|uniref:hypothetical protein n=1 Tax=Niastella sp. OAS944 TaxID=2664089 RepID=UPI00346C3038|nr:hypothetical protein [Chitinophagaceae bacterium OAS944]
MSSQLSSHEDQLLNGNQQMTDVLRDAFYIFMGDEKMKEDVAKAPFLWLYRDIIDQFDLDFDFKQALGEGIFEDVNEAAEVCTNIAILFDRLEDKMTHSWITGVLKTIDHVVIHYISAFLGGFKKYHDKGEETGRYWQMQEQEEPIKSAGANLGFAYQYRSDFEHPSLYKDRKGQIRLRKPNRNKIKRTCKTFFKIAFHSLLNAYKLKRNESAVA